MPTLDEQAQISESIALLIPPLAPLEQLRATRRGTFHVCGLNHTRAEVEVRERYALDADATRALLVRIREEGIGEQALVISTCNRTELYLWSGADRAAERLYELFIAIGADAAPEAGPPPIYQYQRLEAVRHLFAVAAGLDSMILGENQIKQQLREAHTLSREAGCNGPDLHALVESAFRAGKRIRTETALNEGTLCVGKAAVLQGEERLGGLAGRTCLIIGAGKIGRMASRAISERRPGRLWIVNRTLERAEALAAELGGEAYSFENLPCLLPEADLILGAAHAPELVLRRDFYANIARDGERPRRVVMVDVAVPRILDPALESLDGVELYDIGQMEEIVETNRRQRVGAARHAWQIIEEEVEKYCASRAGATLAPLIRHLQTHFDEIFGQEQAQVEALLDEKEVARLHAAHHRIKQRLLHEVITQLKPLAGEATL